MRSPVFSFTERFPRKLSTPDFRGKIDNDDSASRIMDMSMYIPAVFIHAIHDLSSDKQTVKIL